jgi:tetratricopeptide (TPR) repeat protein
MAEDPVLSSDDDYYDLGTFSRTVSTSSRHAQEWFNRGLVWSYAFNHEESVECFKQAIAHDSNCALAYWGLAYALGPNYNKPWGFFDGEELQGMLVLTHNAVRSARAISSTASRVEQALIAALEYRYPQSEPLKDCSIWNSPYAEAMATVYKDFPDDLDVAALYADALMNLTPWQLWDLATGQPSKDARTLEAKAILDRALAQEGGLKHPGLLHLYIHFWEMSGTPEKALQTADHLRRLVPDAGHLEHMPTHLDILCGDYRRAIASNMDAIRADEKFVQRRGPSNFYTLYRAHDYHFRIYAAMFAGQSAVALETIAWLERSVPEELLRVKSPPMADWLEGILAMRVHVLVRFGRWQDIFDLELPKDQTLYCVTTALLHYGKGIAFAVTGEVDEADQQHSLFREAVKRVPSTRNLFNNSCLDILAVADKMLEGELEYRRGSYDSAYEKLRDSISLVDALPYDEPWGWMQPPRHAYGALLLEQGYVDEAASVYSADLGIDDTLPRSLRHPNNVWALHGFHECLLRLGRKPEAAILKPQLTLALATADLPIKASCYCRTVFASN